MKKFVVALAAGMLSVAAVAKGGNESTTGSSVIRYAELPRVLLFPELRNTVDASGRLLVCLSQYKAEWANYGKCVDANGQNAWSLAENALQGFRLNSYEYRYAGSSGQRNLILYFQAP